ncbi:hypothetical protein VB716_11695 [Synechococcus sp. CCY9201]|uniref:hypothetical protein n=1 Tax=Synechococcus sp. CCY9201 TaxID=174697 RepID=UPI002B22190A|nr:hypothetical protein [Synechococcus sp. CCY9201]MEA5474883.1 hypothetical protein [Synechococcus sp. CCY9201]
MKNLIVTLAYNAADYGRRDGSETGYALPLKVLDAEGSVLAEGAASVDQPASFEILDETELVFVRLTWPSGRTETQRIDLQGRSDASVTFSDSTIAPNEWSAWAIPKLNPRTPLALGTGAVDLYLSRYDRVWLRLWRFEAGAWVEEPLNPTGTYRNRSAWQLDLTLASCPWLLQIGGSAVTWRFVSLPGGGPARVLITPRDSSDPRADEMKVIVTGFRADAENLLEFLARDSIRAVHALADSVLLAEKLLAEKFHDPLAAVAGAYYLLRVNAWNRLPCSWFENLSQQFAWLPDAAIVHSIRLLREGTEAQTSPYSPPDLLNQSLKCGWPVYSEGITLLQEAAASLRGSPTRTHDQDSFRDVQQLGAAKAWAGAAASFYGRFPDDPSPLKWAGMPHAPRRRSLNPLLRDYTATHPPGNATREAQLSRVIADSASNLKPTGSLKGESVQLARPSSLTPDDVFLLGSIQG